MRFQQIGWYWNANNAKPEWDEELVPMVSCGAKGFALMKLVWVE